MPISSPLILALGDSLTAGYGLQPHQSFPARLEALLRARYPDAGVLNAGVSGDTTAGALARLPRLLSSLQQRPDLAVVELGANDVLRRFPAERTRANMDAILAELARCGIPVLVATLDVPAFLAPHVPGFRGLLAGIAERHGAAHHPFFPAGVLGRSDMTLWDRIHPNAHAIDHVARHMLPAVERALQAAEAKKAA